MVQGLKIGAVILMAGVGSRFGQDTPKQFMVLGQKKVYLHTYDILSESGLFDEIVLVCPKDFLEEVQKEAPSATLAVGGKTRQESSYLGLLTFTQKIDIVLIHDAVRPFVSKQILVENIEAAIRHGAVDTCIPSADTLVFAPGGEKLTSIPKREDFLRGQTPQTFRYGWIRAAHEKARHEGLSGSHDDCKVALHAGFPVHVVAGEEMNFKITTKFDLLIAESVNSYLINTL